MFCWGSTSNSILTRICFLTLWSLNVTGPSTAPHFSLAPSERWDDIPGQLFLLTFVEQSCYYSGWAERRKVIVSVSSPYSSFLFFYLSIKTEVCEYPYSSCAASSYLRASKLAQTVICQCQSHHSSLLLPPKWTTSPKWVIIDYGLEGLEILSLYAAL